MNSRGKALSAAVSVAALLLAILFAVRLGSDAFRGRSAGPSAEASATAADNPARLEVANPSIETAASVTAANLPVEEQTALRNLPGREDDARPETSVLVVGTPAADSSGERDVRRKPGTVSAECWGLRGSTPRDYVVTLDRDIRTSGEASALISSLRNSDGYVTMFQTSAAMPVRGRRVEFSADIRTQDAARSANLLLRAEDGNGNTVAFDNMVESYDPGRRPGLSNRGVTGTTEWSTQHVVVDIPDEARVITYGVSVFGGGKVWIDNARIEVVTDDMQPTARDIRQSPTPPSIMPVNPASLTRSPRNLEFDLEARTGAAPCN